MISYDNLWNVMKEKGISQYALIKKYSISPAQITRLKRNESVSTHTIEMFCKILDCQVGDIMEYIKAVWNGKRQSRGSEDRQTASHGRRYSRRISSALSCFQK